MNYHNPYIVIDNYIRLVMLTMTRKRGRPLGGKNPDPVREYWRNIQRAYRETKKQADRLPLIKKKRGKR